MWSEAPDFTAWFPEPDGLPRPHWKAIQQYIRSYSTEEHWDAAWQEIGRLWLRKLAERLGGAYTAAESQNFHLLSELDEKGQRELLGFLEQARTCILRSLNNIPLPKRYGKHAVLRFTAEDDYYRYVAWFDPDGAYAGSSGRFLTGSGYMHIAYPHHDCAGQDQAILAHELTHNLLKSFALPRWLNEGLAMLFERDIAGYRYPMLTRELANEHKANWNPKTIQEFWSGAYFADPTGQKYAYGLARILLDFIITDLRPGPADFRDFILHADRKDGGGAAAHDYLGVELGDLVSTFLGPGDWGPKYNSGGGNPKDARGP
ncbi:MAG: hypothetical protein ACREIF_11985 [Chthoniobacterales bacterium]